MNQIDGLFVQIKKTKENINKQTTKHRRVLIYIDGFLIIQNF